MRIRSWSVVSAALVTGVALALPGPTAISAPPPAAPLVTRDAGTTAGGVRLVTGERVRTVQRSGRPVVVVDHTSTGAQRALVTRQLGTRTYVLPAVAEPYLGRLLDPNLFDVGSLAAATSSAGRLAVRISYRGATPTVPGVHLTSAAHGSATGYLTAGSATTFGRALTTQWKADTQAHWPTRTSWFGGVTRISAEAPATGVVTPKFPMLTLIIKTIGSDGKPQPFGFLGVINVDDGRKYTGFAIAEDGEARISVPAGHYSLIGDDFAEVAKDQFQQRVATVNEFAVTKANQTVTLDFRKATTTTSASTPKRSTTVDFTFGWRRTDARGQASLGSFYGLSSDQDLRVAPASKPTVGAVAVTQSWVRAESAGLDPAYTYDLAALDDHIPAKPGKTFTAAQLGVVAAAYYGDGKATVGGFGRGPLFDEDGFVFVSLLPLQRGTARTEYVGAQGANPTWFEAGLLSYDSFDDPGFVDGPIRSLPAGSYRTTAWFRGPLAPAVPQQSGFAFCYACRSGNSLVVALPPFLDSDITHIGTIFGAEDGLPVARFRLYRNGTLVSDTDDALGALVTAPAAKADYRAVLDVDRRLNDPAQSTRTHTELGFSSAAGAGPKAPTDWYCDSGQTDCRVLPVVQARVALPTDLNGRLPAGTSTVTVKVARAQGAAAADAASATLEIRPAGSFWEPVTLTAIGGGRYRGVIDNSGYAGANVDLRVTAADRAGSTFSQTVLRAYTVQGS